MNHEDGNAPTMFDWGTPDENLVNSSLAWPAPLMMQAKWPLNLSAEMVRIVTAQEGAVQTVPKTIKGRAGWVCPLCGRGISPDAERCDCNVA